MFTYLKAEESEAETACVLYCMPKRPQNQPKKQKNGNF